MNTLKAIKITVFSLCISSCGGEDTGKKSEEYDNVIDEHGCVNFAQLITVENTGRLIHRHWDENSNVYSVQYEPTEELLDSITYEYNNLSGFIKEQSILGTYTRVEYNELDAIPRNVQYTYSADGDLLSTSTIISDVGDIYHEETTYTVISRDEYGRVILGLSEIYSYYEYNDYEYHGSSDYEYIYNDDEKEIIRIDYIKQEVKKDSFDKFNSLVSTAVWKDMTEISGEPTSVYFTEEDDGVYSDFIKICPE